MPERVHGCPFCNTRWRQILRGIVGVDGGSLTLKMPVAPGTPLTTESRAAAAPRLDKSAVGGWSLGQCADRLVTAEGQPQTPVAQVEDDIGAERYCCCFFF